MIGQMQMRLDLISSCAARFGSSMQRIIEGTGAIGADPAQGIVGALGDAGAVENGVKAAKCHPGAGLYFV